MGGLINCGEIFSVTLLFVVGSVCAESYEVVGDVAEIGDSKIWSLDSEPRYAIERCVMWMR